MAFAVALSMAAAQHVRQENQPARQQILHGLVGAAGDPAVQLDARLGQGCFGAAANAAADEGVHALGLQKARQGPVAGAVGIHYLRGKHPALLSLINFELGRVAEVLEHLAVFIGHCDFHKNSS